MTERTRNDKHTERRRSWVEPLFAIGTLAITGTFALWLFTSSQPDEPSRTVPASFPQPEENTKAGKFFRECESGINEWIVGQVDYPESIDLNIDDQKAYIAAVDIREDPRIPERVIRMENSNSAEVAVQCTVAARLVPVGPGIEVDKTDWVVRTFTPTGVLNWGWSINANKPGENEVNLLIEPTLSTSNGTVVAGSTRATTFVTRVDVKQPRIQAIGNWIDKNWPSIGAIFAVIATAVLATANWAGDLREALCKAFGIKRS